MHAGGLVVDVEEVDELLDCIDTKWASAELVDWFDCCLEFESEFE